MNQMFTKNNKVNFEWIGSIKKEVIELKWCEQYDMDMVHLLLTHKAFEHRNKIR